MENSRPTTDRGSLETMIALDPAEMDKASIYKVMSGAVVPRPVAWITSRSSAGVVNAAPFSAYTIISQAPPLVLFQADAAERTKDTAANIIATGEFVINVASFSLLDDMHQCSARLPPEVSEPHHFQIALAKSTRVGVPRIASTPIAFECRLFQSFDIGNEPHTIFIGEIVYFQIDSDVFKDGKIDQKKLDPVARVGGPYYARLGELIYRPAL
jgi:flavin reductase (DIM6/NTAB) family NADH-FMN oxidoreductase RutF